MNATFIRTEKRAAGAAPEKEKEQHRSVLDSRAGLVAVYVIALTMMLLQLRSIL